jgi:hypothetical protein
LLQYDPEIATAADQIKPLGQIWMDEFASAYLVLNDKKYLLDIAAKIVSRAEIARTEAATEAQRVADTEKAAADERARIESERRAKTATLTGFFWGTAERRIVVIVIAILLLLALLGSMVSSNSPQQNSGNDDPKQSNTTRSVLSGASSSPIQPSYDCSRAHSVVLRLICSTPDLASEDQQLAAGYIKAMARSSDKAELKADERSWIIRPNHSGADARELLVMYQERIAALNALAN